MSVLCRPIRLLRSYHELFLIPRVKEAAEFLLLHYLVFVIVCLPLSFYVFAILFFKDMLEKKSRNTDIDF